MRDQYGKAKFIQVEALSSYYYFANSKMVPTGQLVLLDKSVQNQVKFIHQLFGIAA
ncbi:hypothetical protein EMIT040CA3_330003 [Bacillus pseudomycoides]